MGFSEEQRGGRRREQMDASRPCRKVSDQCPRLGLVFSVPLHICQLCTQGAAEKTAVTKRPAEEDTTGSRITAFHFHNFQNKTSKCCRAFMLNNVAQQWLVKCFY